MLWLRPIKPIVEISSCSDYRKRKHLLPVRCAINQKIINGCLILRTVIFVTHQFLLSPKFTGRLPKFGAGSGGGTNFFTGQLDSLKLGVYGDNTAQGGQNWGDFNFCVDNDYIANLHLV